MKIRFLRLPHPARKLNLKVFKQADTLDKSKMVETFKTIENVEKTRRPNQLSKPNEFETTETIKAMGKIGQMDKLDSCMAVENAKKGTAAKEIRKAEWPLCWVPKGRVLPMIKSRFVNAFATFRPTRSTVR